MGLVVEGRRRKIQPRKERFFTYISMHVSNVLASKFIEGKLDNPSSEGIIYGLHRNSIHKYRILNNKSIPKKKMEKMPGKMSNMWQKWNINRKDDYYKSEK